MLLKQRKTVLIVSALLTAQMVMQEAVQALSLIHICGAAVGITKNVMDRVTALVNAKVDCIVIDSAHGHSKNIITTLKEIKAAYPDLQVIVGNVATGEATKALIEAGADAVDVYKRQLRRNSKRASNTPSNISAR